jgi:hypothetical protein
LQNGGGLGRKYRSNIEKISTLCASLELGLYGNTGMLGLYGNTKMNLSYGSSLGLRACCIGARQAIAQA